MPPKLSIVRSDDACEGAGKGAQVVQLPVTPRLHSIEGGNASATGRIHSEVRANTHMVFKRPDIGVGHHNAQRHWELKDTTGRKVEYLIGGACIKTMSNHPILAAETVIRRADGVEVVVQLTHNAFAELLKTRLRVPTDIPEDAY